MKRETLETLLTARAEKRAIALATHIETGEEALYRPDRDAQLTIAGQTLTAEAHAALRADRAAAIDTPAGEIFLNVFNPPLRLIVIGAVHIAQPLAAMAALAGYDVTVIDPRRAFASEDRFPSVRLMHDWPDEAMERLAPDGRTAVAALTHDPKIDDPGLLKAIRSPAFYIGALGSKKTHAGRLARLEAEGATAAELRRIRGPIGLDIGAKSPAEIAISVLAEITEALRHPPDAAA